MSDLNSEWNNPDPDQGVPGSWVVIGMFVFGIIATGILWTYSRLHNAPFIPLRRALAEEFSRDAAPRVEGGRHHNGPMTLRVVMKLDFDPRSEDPEVVAKIHAIRDRIIELAWQQTRLQDYEILEIKLIQDVPEELPRRHEITLPVAELERPANIEASP